MEIAVIAGTEFDTALGIDFLKKRGIKGKGFHISNTPEEQSNLQIINPGKLKRIVEDKIKLIKSENISKIMVYCNSLSSAVDMDELSLKYNIPIITPLHVYQKVACNHNVLGVIAANNQSVHGIETVISKKNPKAIIIGVGILSLVKVIEAKQDPKKIVEKFSLNNLLEFFKAVECEKVILGCTHFPYILDELMNITSIPLIEPAEQMLGLLQNT